MKIWGTSNKMSDFIQKQTSHTCKEIHTGIIIDMIMDATYMYTFFRWDIHVLFHRDIPLQIYLFFDFVVNIDIIKENIIC